VEGSNYATTKGQGTEERDLLPVTREKKRMCEDTVKRDVEHGRAVPGIEEKRAAVGVEGNG